MLARLVLLAFGLAALALAGPPAADAGASGGFTPPHLVFPFPEGQTWRITCGYALPPGSAPNVCGHSGQLWNRFALDLQHVDGPAATRGQPVLAAAAGRVSFAGWHPTLGWNVMLDHGGGFATVYGHMAGRPAVRAGEGVEQGARLGVVDCTGLCTGPHIHFALWHHGVSERPEPICGQRGLRAGQLVVGCAPGSSPPAPPIPRADADFDGDGRDDFALLYDYGTEGARLHLFAPNGAALVYSGPEGWWQTEEAGFLPRVIHAVAGDFTGDGRADLALLVDEGDCAARVDVLLAETGRLADPVRWWSRKDYCPRRARFAAASDFDGDGRDDIALVYEVDRGTTRLDVLRADGARFVGRRWWRSGGYWPERVGQVLAGDFDGDGRADLAALYDYGDCQSRVHAFRSSGQSFAYSGPEGWWRAPAFCTAGVRHAAAGDFDGDGVSDLAFLYEESPLRSRIEALRSDGRRFDWGAAPWWDLETDYPAAGVRALLPGDFNGDGRADLAALYDYGDCFAHIHLFASRGDRFHATDWWQTGGYCVERVRQVTP